MYIHTHVQRGSTQHQQIMSACSASRDIDSAVAAIGIHGGNADSGYADDYDDGGGSVNDSNPFHPAFYDSE